MHMICILTKTSQILFIHRFQIKISIYHQNPIFHSFGIPIFEIVSVLRNSQLSIQVNSMAQVTVQSKKIKNQNLIFWPLRQVHTSLTACLHLLFIFQLQVSWCRSFPSRFENLYPNYHYYLSIHKVNLYFSLINALTFKL